MAPDFFRMSGELGLVAGQKGVVGGKQRPVLGRAPAAAAAMGSATRIAVNIARNHIVMKVLIFSRLRENPHSLVRAKTAARAKLEGKGASSG